ncbi:hypothetical protein Mgra_00006846 [Meloidogyne graminicola]|uniref:Uncharacterized protein n=1 Tax=Meloidogyne graminicola TaxID=189291 RepID=A0A8S9ZKA2_9BILA|nr:hypothetical protein Mgra_00006846 [Meloidogyne graminicola]
MVALFAPNLITAIFFVDNYFRLIPLHRTLQLLESSLPLNNTGGATNEKRASYAESIKKRLSIPSLKSASPFHLAKRFSIQQIRRDSINPPNGQCTVEEGEENEEDNTTEEIKQQQQTPYYRRSSIGKNIGGGIYPSTIVHLERLSEEREDSCSLEAGRELSFDLTTIISIYLGVSFLFPKFLEVNYSLTNLNKFYYFFKPSTPATIGALSRKSTRIEMCLGKGELVRTFKFYVAVSTL